MSFYGDEQHALQARFDTSNLAAVFEATIVTDSISDDQRAFIEGRDHFFLSSVNADGWPTVSYKGGPVGMVRVVDEHTVEFPSYDGNGMFLSMGNIESAAKIGLLFIDMVTPQRLRLQATAELSDDPDALAQWPGAQLVVRATVANVFPNCARYIHHHERVAPSKYVPDAAGDQPVATWKRIDMIQPFLPDRDQGPAAEAGTITADEYGQHLANGTS
jgi:predicted pyridoxine 5'-phosphate oxidase superfamily flavin-nucleotide-binding protein|tara:strand:- start:396 stop:1046 length:651 start_codon:yes stop_codon:yes gene_type:complete